MALNIRRIPLVFIFEAPESKIGKIFGRLAGGAIPTVLGSVADAKAVFPALAAIGAGASKIGLTGLGGLLGNLQNKIILPMLVNPSTIEVAKTAKVVKTLTKKGIINQFYQSDPDVISFSGMAAGEKSFLILTQLDTLLKTMENGNRNIVTMVYKFGGVYKGNLENFRITASAENPNVFNYSFEYHFIDRNHFRLFLLAIRPGTLNEAIQNPGKFFTESIKLSASELINTTGFSALKKPGQ